MIRKAIPQDIPELETFIAQFVAQGDVLPRTLDELESLITNCFVAEDDDGKIAGTAILEIYSYKMAEIRSLCVSPTVQGRGVGRDLVNACLQLAQEKNVLEVMAITRSEEFFRACGFDYTLPNLRKALFIDTRNDSNRKYLNDDSPPPPDPGSPPQTSHGG
jgi:amino-acid N-acetyltransferase